MDPITQGIIINLLSKSIEKIGEKFGENTSKQLANFNDKHKSIGIRSVNWGKKRKSTGSVV